MKTYVYSVCGYSHGGDYAPENCPQCGAIHDTVHEMFKDEARHGMAFQGLLNRFFK